MPGSCVGIFAAVQQTVAQKYSCADDASLDDATGDTAAVGSEVFTWKGTRGHPLSDASATYTGVGPTLKSAENKRSLSFPGIQPCSMSSLGFHNNTDKIVTVVAQRSSTNYDRQKYILTSGFDDLSWRNGDWAFTSNGVQRIDLLWFTGVGASEFKRHTLTWTLPTTPFVIQFQFYATGFEIRSKILTATTQNVWTESDTAHVAYTNPTLPTGMRRLTIGGKLNPNQYQYDWPGDIFEVHVMNSKQATAALDLRTSLAQKYCPV